MKLKKLIALTCTFVMAASLLTGCGSSKKSSEVLNVYNVGDYIDMDLIQKFTQETGIQVVYETYDTNEAMYQKLKSGSSKYDLSLIHISHNSKQQHHHYNYFLFHFHNSCIC